MIFYLADKPELELELVEQTSPQHIGKELGSFLFILQIFGIDCCRKSLFVGHGFESHHLKHLNLNLSYLRSFYKKYCTFYNA